MDHKNSTADMEDMNQSSQHPQHQKGFDKTLMIEAHKAL